MDFTWNQALYEDIVNRAESLEKKRDMKHILDIGSEKYEALVTVAEEEFLTHPDGPYPGTRDEMKHDENYLRKKLIQNYRKVPYSGHAIQAAIDDAAAMGGGIVRIPEGTYYTGALVLKSGVELNLSDGATLRFMRNKSNTYYPVRFSRWEGVECMNFSPFIYADGAEDIAVTGTGTLDGAADEFNWMPWKFGYFGEKDQQIQRERLFTFNAERTDPEQRIFDDTVSMLRPPFIQFYRCRNVLIRDVRIANSPFWEVNPVLCDNVLIRGIHVETNLYNNDGVDPECSRNVLIEDCYFQTGDDCIAIKSGRNQDGRRVGVPTANVVIRRNHFSNGHGGITIGSEISGGVHHIFADENSFDSPNLDYPIRFKTNAKRGGSLDNIYVRNSVVNKSRVAIVHADFFYEEGRNGSHLPDLHNIVIDGFLTRAGGCIDAKYPFYLKGFADAPIRNVTFRNMYLDGVHGHAVLANIRNLRYDNVNINGIRQPDRSMDVGEEKSGPAL